MLPTVTRLLFAIYLVFFYFHFSISFLDELEKQHAIKA